MRAVLLAITLIVSLFTVSPVFCDTAKLNEIGMFADEYVGKTFTFDAWVTLHWTGFFDNEGGTYGLSLYDEAQHQLTESRILYCIDKAKLCTMINKEQTKELMRTLEKDNNYKRRLTFKITKESYKGHPYYAGRITSIKRVSKD